MTEFEPVYLGNRPRVLGHYTTFPENEQLRMMLSTGFPAKGAERMGALGNDPRAFSVSKKRSTTELCSQSEQSRSAPSFLLLPTRVIAEVDETSRTFGSSGVRNTKIKWRDLNSQCQDYV